MKKTMKHILSATSLTLYSMGVGYFINYSLLKLFKSYSNIAAHPQFGSGGALVSIFGFGLLIPIMYLILINSEVDYKKVIKSLLLSPILIVLIFTWEIIEILLTNPLPS